MAMIMIMSVVAFAIPGISAKVCNKYFNHQETIYIDLRSFTGWENDSAKIRVYTYYGNSNDDWNVENNKKDSECNNNACFQKAINPTKITDNLYSFSIQGSEVGYVKVLRLDSGMNNCWNSTGYIYADNRSGSANCIKITGWDNSYQWTTYSAGGDSSGYHEVTAKPDAASITNNSSIFPIDATFYDYYTDTEVAGGWGNIKYEESHGYWEPYQYLNNKIAAASSGVNYPMYFGNFFDKNDGYVGEGSSNMVNFSNWVNNSARLGGTHKSVVGLTGSSLVDGDLMYAVNGGGNSSVKVPFFDKSFLQTNGVGSVVNTKFPMRKVTSNGITTYVFDSTDANDNAWFSADHQTMYYGQGTSKGAKDALYYYSNPRAASGYGFFPFDSNRGADKEALNFAFGMRVDIPFNLGGDPGHYGQIKGTNGSYDDQKFTFSGDDDVWVYIDGNLVLDLGGDHQKAEGTINFAGGQGTGTVSVTYGSNTLNSATRNTSFSITNDDPTVEHTLTMFYVERGMVESNLSFDFNFAPIGNELIVDKTVNTASVNNSTDFKNAVAAADTFSFNQPTANGKQSSKGTISDSTYTLKNAESISFKDQFDVPTPMTVTESYNSNLSYSTTWKAADLVLKGKGKSESEYTIGSDTGVGSDFTYQTLDTTSEFAMTRVQLSYVNTPEVAPVTITKTVTDLGAGETDNTEFGGTVSVDLGDGNGFKTYNLTYSTGGASYRLTSEGKLATGGKLKNGRTLTFEGIPQGAKVKFVEDSAPSGYSFVSVTGGTNGITVGPSDNAITVTNKKLSGGGTLYVTKKLDGEDYTGDAFSFTAEGVTKTGYVTGTNAYVNSAVNGTVTFDLTFTQPGNYLYKITEDDLSADLTAKGYSKDRSTIYAKFTVVSGASGLAISGTPQYYSDEACTTPVTAVFRNTTEHAKITIKKTTDKGSAEGNVFAVVKVKDSTPLSKDQINALIENDSAKYVQGTTLSDGSLEFDNLPIYQNGDQVYDNATSQWVNGTNYMSGIHTPQTYMVFEYSAKNGYNTNNTVKFVTFPYEGQYSVTFDYVNLAVINPASGFGGTMRFFVIGLSVLGTAALLAMAYVFFKKRRVKASYAPRHGRK
ncbi:MAG: hypothetical protein VZQ45_06315 [Ruminococcus sp.]|nr:hypothetical protein [Ruminococcus sp.]MEE3492594.1 hypothetical protein [Ruminococcus sp.]